ncbi:hypothetical protein DSCO28_71600 [Desulfosarcina ovata subsp. sediminis]|uniref:Glycosyl transferase family 28 C-terminal domain-containing protein n=1 Tax=Desulfosarcina ovata subsp. sediminis TaxID=885957 RepID=A0A5K8A2N2_9BACT|nr:glycosyltransferase [Desulfosarcina ovata]BBO86594.1 hypothetical protein DSCO28_71600 [Desulfosarcina ovata subsp. sediminis]
MKIFFYCQHVLGLGHFFRTLEICRKLDAHDVVLVTGGTRVEIPLPDHVREKRLPTLMMDEGFKTLISGAEDQAVADIQAQRQTVLWELFREERPDLLIIELYPFGRKKFRVELDPILSAVKDGRLPPCRVVCSLRDILVEKDDTAAYEQRVVNTMNAYFDALLVHADPGWLRLDQTFGRVPDLEPPLIYTGFVAERAPRDARWRMRTRLGLSSGQRLVIASAGGGKVGGRLLGSVVSAMAHLPDDDLRLIVFTGPFMDDATVDDLRRTADPRIVVQRFTDEFLAHLAAADLSISMAGYNTCMNILAAGVPALVWPFAQNREQRMRAELLADHGALTVLGNDDLEPGGLAGLVKTALEVKPCARLTINLDGAAETAAWLETGLASKPSI